MANTHGGISGKYGVPSNDEKYKKQVEAGYEILKKRQDAVENQQPYNPTPAQISSAMQQYSMIKNPPKYDYAPSEYQLKYGKTIEGLLEQLNDRTKAGFSYNPAADANLQEYFKQYDLQADSAIDKSIGSYAPAGGGMSSTALALANEAAAAYEAKKNALVPEFYNAAYNQYLNQNSSLADLANSYLALENNNYNIWAANQTQKQVAAQQQYEQNYIKWLQNLNKAGYTVNDLGQAVKKAETISGNGSALNDMQKAWQTSYDNWLDYYRKEGYDEESLELAAKRADAEIKKRYGVSLEQFDSTAGIDTSDEKNSLTSTMDDNNGVSDYTREIYNSLISQGITDEEYAEKKLSSLSVNQRQRVSYISDMIDALKDHPRTEQGNFPPSTNAADSGMMTLVNIFKIRNAKYTNNDFYWYFVSRGYSDRKSQEMANNVSKRYQQIDVGGTEYGNPLTADSIAYAIQEELEKNKK